MSIDLEILSPKELNALITQAQKRKDLLTRRKPIGAVREKLITIAKNEGYTIEELFGKASPRARSAAPKGEPGVPKTRKPRKPTGKVAPKYRNPENPTDTWTGRGRQPRWLAALTAQGRKPDEFLIAPWNRTVVDDSTDEA